MSAHANAARGGPRALDVLAGRPTFEELRDALLAPHLDRCRELRRAHIYGAARMGARVKAAFEAANVEVLGFLDSSPKKHGTTYLGLPVRSPDSIDWTGDATAVVASSVYPHEMLAALERAGCRRRIFYPVLSVYAPERFPAERELAGAVEDLAAHAARYVELGRQLADERSKEILEALLQFRLTLDPSFTQRAQCHGVRHYFDPQVLNLGESECFVDGGAYDGDTTRDFIAETNGRYRRIHLFEPDPALLEKARASLVGQHDVVFHQNALFSRSTTLRFAPGEQDGSLDQRGHVTVAAVSLDEAVSEPTTLIKLDVEGAERPVLEGAKGHIAQYGPKLALSVYHLSGDFWRLPDQVAGYRAGYRLYLRHYSPSVIDTVLYCI
jgi:FkbM family methyltransferase